MADSLEDRLRSHAQAFDGLLSLIPAKYYYGEDNSEQWQRKKQTKEEARNAKRAKLDPDASTKTAKDIMDENARKRKREEDGVDSDGEPLGSEKPREGLNRGAVKGKKQKKDEDGDAVSGSAAAEKKAPNAQEISDEQRRQRATEKRRAKREQKKAKAAAELEKKQAQASKKEQSKSKAGESTSQASVAEDAEGSDPDDDDDDVENDMEVMEGLAFSDTEKADKAASTASSTPNTDSPAFDLSNIPSGSSSISSMPPNEPVQQKAEKPKIKIPKGPPPEQLKERLQKRLEELRAARNADGLDGKPARSRQELIEARRQKEEKRKQLKKEQRQKEKDAQQLKEDEAMARRFSPTSAGSLLNSPRSPLADNASVASANNFSFGRIAFTDGQEAKADLTDIFDPASKRKGPQDPLTALKAAEAKKLRLGAYDETKRKEIEEKDMWLNAKKRAHGERVRDDTSLLKKALKRKDSAKRKSEKDWNERKEGIEKSMANRQRKREENLQKRKDDKGKKSSGGAKKGKSGGKPKARPGFEGSFKTGGGSKKK